MLWCLLEYLKLEYEVEIEDVSDFLDTPIEPFPYHIPYIVSYMGTLTHRSTCPIHSPSFFSMANLSGYANTSSVHTLSLVVGGGIIPISTISPSVVAFYSTSIPIPSGSTQP